jgi:hypothetical protein
LFGNGVTVVITTELSQSSAFGSHVAWSPRHDVSSAVASICWFSASVSHAKNRFVAPRTA